jgi:pseudaminic acid synthase
MNKHIRINCRDIGQDYSPYIIAEMSANHNGSIDNAIKLINCAKKSGADALKLQTYKPETITLNSDSEDFIIKGGLWNGRTLYDLYKEAHTPWEWHRPLFDYAKKLDLTIFSSPFDATAVDLLEDLNSPAYKVASFEAVDLPLIKYIASTRKPMIISTGMANFDEISEAIDAAYDGGCRELALLHCVSGYPALPNEYNLRTIADMIERFGFVTGLSDHTLDNTTAIASISCGAAIIEKHFTLNRSAGGPDDSFSLEPPDLKALCRDTKTAWAALGHVSYGLQSSELPNVKFRRSLYFVKDMLENEIITPDCIKSVRPGFGIPPKYYDDVIGKRATKSLKKFTPVSFESFK